jgi:hypothetical protein
VHPEVRNTHNEQNIEQENDEIDKKEWNSKIPDTARLNYWTNKEDGTFCVSYNEGKGERKSEEARFKLIKQTQTKMGTVIRILCEDHNHKTTLRTIIDYCYKEERNTARKKELEDSNTAYKKTVLDNARGVVHSLKSKLSKNGINPNIISALPPSADQDAEIKLAVPIIENGDETDF